MYYSLLSPFIRICAYLSSCGLNFNYIGLPDYAFGAVGIANVEPLGLNNVFLPIPSISNSSMILALGKKKEIVNLKNGEVEGIEKTINGSADHRFFDGAYGAKMNVYFKKVIEEMDEKVLGI